MSDDIVDRLRHCADETWPYALVVSNLGKPETDNNHGRAAVAMRDAIGVIEDLRKRLDKTLNDLDWVKQRSEAQGAEIERLNDRCEDLERKLID